MTQTPLAGDQWLTGGRVLVDGVLQSGLAVRLRDGQIAAIIPQADLPVPAAHHLSPAQILLPGLLDAQVNGGGGVLFNDAPEQLPVIAAAHRALGVHAIIPTLITDAPDLVPRAVEAVLNYPGGDVRGLHLEGPFISPARAGIHDPRFIRRMTDADASQLAAIAGRLAPRKLMVTLAPEEVEDTHLRQLAAAGVIIAIGHTVASYQRCHQALDLGARGFTHLWNAMPGPQARAPGPVAAAFERGYAGLIADLIHVDPAIAALTLRVAPGRIVLVSDCMSPAGSAITQFTLQARPITRANGRLTGADGTLAGADLTLPQAIANVTSLGLSRAQAWLLASLTPAAFLNLRPQAVITTQWT